MNIRSENSYFIKNNRLFFFYYLPIKLVSICIIFLASSLFSESIGQFNSNYSIFYQVDGPQYYFGCDLNSANILFTITSCLLDIKSSSAITAICTAIIITLMRDFIFCLCKAYSEILRTNNFFSTLGISSLSSTLFCQVHD